MATYGDNDLMTPMTFSEMLIMADAKLWFEATDREYNAQLQNGTWKLVPRPEHANVMGTKWVWKLKEDDLRKLTYKTRIVGLGYMQKFALDYFETYAPAVRFETACRAVHRGYSRTGRSAVRLCDCLPERKAGSADLRQAAGWVQSAWS